MPRGGVDPAGASGAGRNEVKANAALDANRAASSIEEQIGRMLAEAEATDAREDRQFGAESSGPALPADLKRRGDRLARLKACREKLANRAAAAALASRRRSRRGTWRRRRPGSASGAQAEGTGPSVIPTG